MTCRILGACSASALSTRAAHDSRPYLAAGARAARALEWRQTATRLMAGRQMHPAAALAISSRWKLSRCGIQGQGSMNLTCLLMSTVLGVWPPGQRQFEARRLSASCGHLSSGHALLEPYCVPSASTRRIMTNQCCPLIRRCAFAALGTPAGAGAAPAAQCAALRADRHAVA